MKPLQINTWKLLFYVTVSLFLLGIYLFFINKDLVNGMAVLSITASIYISLIYMDVEKKAKFKKLTFAILIAVLLLTITILFFSIFTKTETDTIKTLGILICALIYIARTARIEK